MCRVYFTRVIACSLAKKVRSVNGVARTVYIIFTKNSSIGIPNFRSRSNKLYAIRCYDNCTIIIMVAMIVV